jgi:hypothetical protein
LKNPKDSKNRHYDNQEVCDWWRAVQLEFDRWFTGIEGHDRGGMLSRVSSRQLDSLDCSPDHLDKQAIGCLASSFCLRFGIVRSGDFYDVIASWLRDNFDSIYTRYRERCEVLSVAKVKQSEIEGETYDGALDPRVVNEMACRVRCGDLWDF